ncbi:MAG: hypothetical protein ACMXX9_00030 [Candidatus Woesearchaeota archaeon]
MIDFRTVIFDLENMGFWSVVLPFLLVFTIIFAILQKSYILGKDKNGNPRKNFNVAIALIMGLAFVVPSVLGRYPPNADPVQIVANALPGVSLLAIAIISVLLLLGIFGKTPNADDKFGGIIAIFVIGAVAVIFGISAGWFGTNLPTWLWFLYDRQFQSLLVTILIFGLVIWFITKEDKPAKDDDKSMLKKLLKDIN